MTFPPCHDNVACMARQIDVEALRSLIEARSDPFVLIDDRYRIVAANSRYAALYGLTPKQIERFHCHQVSHHRSSPCHEHGEACPLREVMATGETTEVVHVHYGCGARQDVVRIIGHPIRIGSRLLLGESIEPLQPVSVVPAEPADAMLGASPAFVAALAELARAARFALPVLLFGETGVGKELAARRLHAQSPRAGRAFVTVDCANLPTSLAEDTLFGHVRGAYSGAMSTRAGLFEQADGGTLFLDEVSELAPEVQAKLLRILETGELRRLGEGHPKRVDVRVVCATNRDLLAEVRAGRFRPDLYYRIAGLKVVLPPLRDRIEDITLLASRFLDEFRLETGAVPALTPDALAWLRIRPWPGNVRELRQIMGRAAVQSVNGLIDAQLLAQLAIEPEPRHADVAEENAGAAQRAAKGIDPARLAAALARHGNNRAAAARELGVSERTLYRWLGKACTRVGSP
ncbi:sigma-54 interaction domain-containing protein [Piscinibacter sp.]|uniref:sigma-54 interaction domain-containing protein n=1 Tax=Piscinibacter sp. TaxID=1903157 RepID=UPI0039E64B07